jgi:methylenetetrahydrofolate dehydrogenase (NADP+)/methenyltetrahydrofolate cyclohydrolase
MIVDGRAYAEDILSAVRARIAPLGRTPVVRAVSVQPSPATESYLKIKMARAEAAGMTLEVVRLPDSASKEDVSAALNAPGADAALLQLPVPEPLYQSGILETIPIEKDADVLSAAAYARFDAGEPGALTPPVAAGVLEILDRAGVDISGMRAVVVGRGQLVGKPAATVLLRRGAQVSVIHRSTPPEEQERLLKEADVIVSGAGVAHLIKPGMVKPGAVLIDAGTSGSAGGVAGDVDPACADLASLFTPVPGGVGPVAVACLFQNVATLLTKEQS